MCAGCHGARALAGMAVLRLHHHHHHRYHHHHASPPPPTAAAARAATDERWWTLSGTKTFYEGKFKVRTRKRIGRTPLAALDERYEQDGTRRRSPRIRGRETKGSSRSTEREWWEESRGERETGEGVSGDEGRRKKARDVDGQRRTENACQLDNSTSTSRPWLPPRGSFSAPASRTLRPRRRTRRRSKGKGESAWVTRGGTRNYSRGRDYPSEHG